MENNINGCGHTHTFITKILDKIEKEKDLYGNLQVN